MSLPFLIRIVYQFSGRSIRKYSCRFFLGFFTISLEDLPESISSIYFRDCVPFFGKIFHKVSLPFLTGIVYQLSRRSIRKYIIRFLLGLCAIIAEDLAASKSFIFSCDCAQFLWKMYKNVYVPFLIRIVCHFSGRFMRNYTFCLFLTLCTISLEDLAERISFISYWDCAPFLWKICQKVYLPLLTAIVYHFSARIIKKYIFHLFLTLCSISPENLSESISFVSYWDCVPILWKIYHKVYLSFLIGILYHFYGRSIRKYIFGLFLKFCTISLENLPENISFICYWDCAPFLWKISQKLYLPLLFPIVYYFFGKIIKKYNFRLFLTLCTISLQVYLSFWYRIVYHSSGISIRKYNFRFLLVLCTISL